MIDAEIKEIIAPALQKDEEVLWAEKASQDQRQNWIRKNLVGNRVRFFGAAPMMALCFYFSGSGYLKNGFEFQEGAMLLGGILFGWSTWHSFQAFLDPEKYEYNRPFFGYSLTNQRLLYIGIDHAIADERSAKFKYVSLDGERNWRLKFVPDRLQLWPVGQGLLTRYNIYFLDDFKTSKSMLETLLKENLK